MSPATVSPAEMVHRAVDGLRSHQPEMSADRVLVPRQRGALLIGALLLVALTVSSPILAGRVLVGGCTALYALVLAYRTLLVARGSEGGSLVHVTDADALAVPAHDLPTYTVLVPAYREPEVVPGLLEHLAALDYPADRLQILLLLEADDDETIAAAQLAARDPRVRIIEVPVAEPRTKPKACNYGLQVAQGEMVTIYDAEDVPDPLQLRRAVVALRRLGAGYACVQAQLAYFNTTQNLLTRWFAREYATWFRFLLPGLADVGAPIPLGGTSNHFRTQVLREAGAWDPYNVTEDADLGIRLTRGGYSVGVLASVTLEEANSDAINWVKQRSRWYKGYLQTWLVHMRHPARLHRQLGWRGAAGFHLFVGGTPLVAALNPVFWGLTIVWVVQRPDVIPQLFPPLTFYVALVCLLLGNASVVYANVFTARASGHANLLTAALTMPGYWVLQSVAAVKAFVQLCTQASYWEKTTHGLHLRSTSSVDTVIDLAALERSRALQHEETADVR